MWREGWNLVMTKDGLPYYVDEDGEYWRALYLFIENATCYDMVKDEEDFLSAVAFRHFQRLLADYPASNFMRPS